MNATQYLAQINALVTLCLEGKVEPQKAVLAMALSNSRPAPDETMAETAMSTAEILDLMSQACDLTANEVAEVMISLGYRVVVNPIVGVVWNLVDYQPRSTDTDS